MEGGRGLPGNLKGVSEEDRASRRKQAVDQLGDLNKTVDSEKMAQQQAQQAGNPQPQNRAADISNSNVPGLTAPDGKPHADFQSLMKLNESEATARRRFGMAFGANRGELRGQRGGGGIGGGGGQGGFGGGGGGFFAPGMSGSGRASGPASGRLSFGVGVNSNSGAVGSIVQEENNFNINSNIKRPIDGIVPGQVDYAYFAADTAGWTQAGGLSLPIEIQREGNVLRFSRASGSPRLALAVRPNESDKLGLGLVWAAIWASIAVWLLRLIAGSTSGSKCRQAAAGLCALGLLGMFFLPSPLSEACFIAFAISAIVLAIGVLRRRCQNAAA